MKSSDESVYDVTGREGIRDPLERTFKGSDVRANIVRVFLLTIRECLSRAPRVVRGAKIIADFSREHTILQSGHIIATMHEPNTGVPGE